MTDKPIKVLRIEDNPGDARLIEEMLSEVRSAPFDSECVDRLSEGLERLAAGGIDLTLLDLGLPDSSGLETFIRAHAQSPKVPIIVLSGLDDEALAVDAVGRGTQDYLAKGQVDSNMLGRAMHYAIERKRAEVAILESERRYKHMYSMVRLMCDNLPDLIWTKDLEGKFVFANKACCEKLLNVNDTDEPIGKTDIHFAKSEKESHPEDQNYHTFGETCAGSDLAVLESKRPQRFDEFCNVQGKFLYLDVYKAPFWDEKGDMIGTVGCARIVTKEKQLEKEVLLLEIHHRVKNSLQVVSSLLNMQARATSNKDTIEILSESRDMINTMALIHSQLYESQNLSAINMKGFLDKLLRQLLQSYPVSDMKITQVVHVADYPLPISIAVPVGLIVNELLANVFKHAFVNRKEGVIEISFNASEKGVVSLTVSDDGVGLPDGFEINGSKTLGLRVVKILVEDQLDGFLTVVRDKGTTFKVEFEMAEG